MSWWRQGESEGEK